MKTVSAVALALMLGTSAAMLAATTDAQARAKVTVRPVGPDARVAMCNNKTKGMYRTQQDGNVFAYGACLNDVAVSGW